MTHYPELLNNQSFPLTNDTEQILNANGKMYLRAYDNNVDVFFKEANDTSFAKIATISANEGKVVDTVFPTKNGKIKVVGGNAYMKLYRE